MQAGGLKQAAKLGEAPDERLMRSNEILKREKSAQLLLPSQ